MTLLADFASLLPYLSAGGILINAWFTRGTKIEMMKTRVEMYKEFVSKKDLHEKCENCIMREKGKK